MFWDSSAIIPLCLEQQHTAMAQKLLREDSAIVAWWGTVVECCSAFSRLRRESVLSQSQEDSVRQFLSALSSRWTEVQPGGELRTVAVQLLLLHNLRAADSLQLAAALVWADKIPDGSRFVCLDSRLRDVARKEGFTLLPTTL